MLTFLISPRLCLAVISFAFCSLQAQAQAQSIPAPVNELLTRHTCLTCHTLQKKLVGPSYEEIAKRKYSRKKLVELLYNPEPSNWPGYVPMAPMPQVPREDAKKIAKWIASIPVR